LTQEAKPGEVFLIDKPYGWTSFQAVKKVKWMRMAKKCGHAGTLDPLATGLLVICTERSTKKINDIQAAEKEYVAEITLGATTPSYDMETEVDQHFPTEHITQALIEETLHQFRGTIMQRPPLFSAIKVDGKRAYTLARGGVEHELAARPVIIHEIEIVRFEAPVLTLRFVCGKGTYIRSLAFDIGKALNSGGYLSGLRRTRIGEYKVSDAIAPESVQNLREQGNLSK
jgi:tRNA pseudouridine55 synthase